MMRTAISCVVLLSSVLLGPVALCDTTTVVGTATVETDADDQPYVVVTGGGATAKIGPDDCMAHKTWDALYGLALEQKKVLVKITDGECTQVEPVRQSTQTAGGQ